VSFNYLVLIPLSIGIPVLESAEQVNGQYMAEDGAVVNTLAATIELPAPLTATRFYRLRAEGASRITGVRVSPSGTILINYAPVAD